MKYKAWESADAYALLQALEQRVSPLGYHVAMGRARKLDTLEFVVFPDVKLSAHDALRANIAMPTISSAGAHTLRLRGIETLEEPQRFGASMASTVSKYEHGKGKNTRLVEIFFQDVHEVEQSA